MSLSGPKAPFDGVSIRTTMNDVQKFRGRYVCLLVEVSDISDDNVATAVCAISKAPVSINGFSARENITRIIEAVCYVDNMNGSLFYEYHAALDDVFDINSFALLIPFAHKHSTIFGY